MREAGSGGANNGRSRATRSRNTLAERVQPTRSPITEAGISGNSINSDRIAGSNVSTADPVGGREYRGGTGDASARLTVPRDTLSRRAIARADTPSDRCSRRISAQSSTASTLPSVEEWPHFHSATPAQFSPGSDTEGPGRVSADVASPRSRVTTRLLSRWPRPGRSSLSRDGVHVMRLG